MALNNRIRGDMLALVLCALIWCVVSFWKTCLHTHGPLGEEQMGFKSYTEVIQLVHDAGYRATCVVEHEHFVTPDAATQGQMEKMLSAGGSCEGLMMMLGAEGRSHAAWGEHLTYVCNQPKLLIATHPNTIMSDGEPQIAATRWRDDDAFRNCNFIEIFNGWGRSFKPKRYWNAEVKWDKVLSMGCRVFAVADDDSMLDFPGIAHSPCARPEFVGKGLPNQFSVAGIGWSMVLMGNDPTGLHRAETTGIGIGMINDPRGEAIRTKFVDAMTLGRFYASTGVTISNIQVEGNRITVETLDGERMRGSIDNGEIIASNNSNSISFEVPSRATYARVTASKGEVGNDSHAGEQWAWTQPFWVSVDGVVQSEDPRHKDTSKSAWSNLPDNKKLILELYEEQAGDILRQRSSHQSPRTRDEMAQYYAQQLPVYLKVWGPEGRVGWGYFDDPEMSFQEAGWNQADRLAQRGRFDKNSIVLDLGCGTGVNSFMLARKYGCKVLGLDISTEMIRHGRSIAATTSDRRMLARKVRFFEGTIGDLIESIRDCTFQVLFKDFFPAIVGNNCKFTHMWSTCTIFQLREKERVRVFEDFASIATDKAILVVDDAHCPNKVICKDSQEGIYDRLQLEHLWRYHEYVRNVENSGFFIDWHEDLTEHLDKSYRYLRESALDCNQNDLAVDYGKTLQGIRSGDFGWTCFTARLKAADHYYERMLETYLRVWGPTGRVGWGYFDDPEMSFQEAGVEQADRLAQRGEFDSNSIVLDLGCGTGVNSFMLARKYGCKVLGLDISGKLADFASNTLKSKFPDLLCRVFFYTGTLEDLVEDVYDGDIRKRFTLLFPSDQPAEFTHMWSTCTLFQFANKKRRAVFPLFSSIATADAKLVVDDGICMNEVIGAAAQQGIYDRLLVDKLWSYDEYQQVITNSGYNVDWHADQTSPHLSISYNKLAQSAGDNGYFDLQSLYLKTLEGIECSDFGWGCFVATRNFPGP